jgi:hypothetical protein
MYANGTSTSLSGSSTFTFNSGTGVVTATDFSATSDQRIKSNISNIEYAMEKINALRGVYYNRIGDTSRKIGLIAQEVEKILPEVVVNDDLKSVTYGNIVALLIEGLKELAERVSILENR